MAKLNWNAAFGGTSFGAVHVVSQEDARAQQQHHAQQAHDYTKQKRRESSVPLNKAQLAHSTAAMLWGRVYDWRGTLDKRELRQAQKHTLRAEEADQAYHEHRMAIDRIKAKFAARR